MLPDHLSVESAALHRLAGGTARPAPIQVEYRVLDPLAPPPPDALAVVHFSAPPSSSSPMQTATWTKLAHTDEGLAHEDVKNEGLASQGLSNQGLTNQDLTDEDLADGCLSIDVALTPLQWQPAPAEVWLASGPVRRGRQGIVRHARDEHYLFGLIELDEREQGGIRAASEAAYAAIREFQAGSPYPHLLRMWNYLDAINEGAGDLERYREFCVGRARGIGPALTQYPAATAIGQPGTTHRLQVFWLAGRHAGHSIENPRQVSAFRYPRTYGPTSPGFSRATLASDGTLLISGTASIVGHVSQHPDDPAQQLEETLCNLAELRRQTGSQACVPGRKELLKVYLRDPTLLDPVAGRLDVSYPHTQRLFLRGDICRRELLLEIESIQLG